METLVAHAREWETKETSHANISHGTCKHSNKGTLRKLLVWYSMSLTDLFRKRRKSDSFCCITLLHWQIQTF